MHLYTAWSWYDQTASVDLNRRRIIDRIPNSASPESFNMTAERIPSLILLLTRANEAKSTPTIYESINTCVNMEMTKKMKHVFTRVWNIVVFGEDSL